VQTDVQGDHASDGQHPCQAPTFFQARQHHCSNLCVSLQQTLLVKQGRECQNPKPIATTARSGVKPLPGSSRLLSSCSTTKAHQGWLSSNHHPERQLGTHQFTFVSGLHPFLEKIGQNELGCAVVTCYPQGTSFRKGPRSRRLNAHDAWEQNLPNGHPKDSYRLQVHLSQGWPGDYLADRLVCFSVDLGLRECPA